MKGVCIDVDHSALLQPDEEYFLFPAKPHHYYVSRFDNKQAHLGCYPADRFRITEKESWTPEPKLARTFYKAQLIWRTRGYQDKPLKEYIIHPKGTHCLFWHDRERKKFGGCFPLHWFTNFEMLAEQPKKQVEKPVTFVERPGGQLAFF